MMEDGEGARDASFFLSATAGTDWALQASGPGLETPLGCPQSQYNKGCWAPRENSSSLEAFLTFFRATSSHRHIQHTRNIISRQSSSPPSPGGCSRGTCVRTHMGQLYLRLWG